MKRRQVLQALGSAVLGWPLAGRLEAAEQKRPCKILFFSRSVLFEHPVVRRQGDELSLGATGLARVRAAPDFRLMRRSSRIEVGSFLGMGKGVAFLVQHGSS